MAKQGTLLHPKTFKLAKVLGIERWQALGLLESIFSFTAEYAPTGDFTDVDETHLGEYIGFRGDTCELLPALVQAGFMDENEAGQRSIHDWSDHAPDYVRKRLKRKGKEFFDVRRTTADFVRETADNGRQCLPSRARITPTQPSPTQPHPAPARESNLNPELMDWITEQYPRPVGNSDGAAVVSVLDTAEKVQTFRENLPGWVEYFKATKWSYGLGKLLYDGHWCKQPPAIPNPDDEEF